jgi:type VI secretion system secreted protein VgrG
MTGWKSDSSKHNGGYNELVFEDKQGSETIRMHAERDHEITVKHAETRTIGEVFAPPKGSPSRNTTLKNGDDLLTIQAGDQTISVPAGNQTTTVAMAISTTADISISCTVGPSTVSICPGSISLVSPVINLTAESAVNITGATVNAGALLDTPELNAGAATVGGMPV